MKSKNESTIFGVSLRGLIALLLVITLCILAISGIAIPQQLYSLAQIIVAFYFGHQIGKNQQNQQN